MMWSLRVGHGRLGSIRRTVGVYVAYTGATVSRFKKSPGDFRELSTIVAQGI